MRLCRQIFAPSAIYLPSFSETPIHLCDSSDSLAIVFGEADPPGRALYFVILSREDGEGPHTFPNITQPYLCDQ
jgi:hypothetical protein